MKSRSCSIASAGKSWRRPVFLENQEAIIQSIRKAFGFFFHVTEGRRRLSVPAAAVLSLLAADSSYAATSVAVNFQGRASATSSATTPLAPTDVAGVVPQAHWNNIDDNANGNNATTSALVDDNGAATTVTLTYTANDSWNNDTAPASITSGDARMMNGIMKASTGTSQTLRWNNLTASSYDVYLYLNENGDGAQVSVSSDDGTTYYLTETHRFDDNGRFIPSTSQDPSVLPLANYVKFTALAPVDGTINLVVTHITGTDGAGLAGMQLVTPSGDTPVTIVTQPLSQTVAAGNSVTFGVSAYGENNTYQWYKGTTQIPGATSATYTTPALVGGDNGAKYHVVVSNGVNSQTSSDATVTVKAATDLVGYLRHAVYPNATRADVENGVPGAPSYVEAIPSFQTAINDGINNYSEVVSGYFTPAVSGHYVFFVSADDDSDLFLSTDASPASKRLIAQETGWSNASEWTVSSGGSNLAQKRSDQFSPDGGATVPFADGIELTAGVPYYIEGVHHQGTGGDNFSVTYKLVDDADPVSADSANLITGDLTRLTGNVISFKTTATTDLTIWQEPQDQTVTEGFVGTFTVGAQTDSELRPKYQWRRNGDIIPGATGPSYAFNVSAADNNAKYSVVVSVPGFATTVTSREANLTVRSPVFTAGFLKYELWQGKSRQDVENGAAGSPTSVSAISGFSTKFNAGDPPNDFADRVSGFFIPPVDGNYVFFIGGDDDADLFLSPTDKAADKKLIARETGYSGQNNWNTAGAGTATEKRSDLFSASQWATPNVITLTKGTRYYIEAVHREGGGGDWLGVYAKLESEADPADGTPSNLTGSKVGFLVAPASVTLTQQPANATATEGWTATFNVAATTDSQVNIISYQWKRNGVDIPGATSASYTTQPLSLANNSDKYTVVVNAPGATAVTSAQANLAVSGGALSTGFVKYELWPGGNRADVESGASGAAPTLNALTSMVTTNHAGDPPANFADRVSGFFNPPSDGNYVFFVGGDDDVDLFLSTDADPVNKKLIAHEAGWSSYLNWNAAGGNGSSSADKRSDQYAATQWPSGNTITLSSNQRYYIEVVHHEGTGGDWAGATWKLDTDADPADGSPSTLTGDRISFYGHPSVTTITQQPTAFTGAEGFSATFTAAATTTSEFNVLRYQWQLNGVDIPGATGATYTTAPLTQANASDKYRVIVSGPGSSPVTSAEVGVTLQGTEFATGAVKHEVWAGVTDRFLVESGGAGDPTKVEVLPTFQTPADTGDNYVDRLSGFFIPARSGNYVFFVGGDDDADLFLSTDEDPLNKKLIAQEAGYSGFQLWTGVGGGASVASDKRSDTFAGSEWPTGGTISLTEGVRYYMEVVHHDGTGGDWVGVYAKLATDPDPVNTTTASNLSGSTVGADVPPQSNQPELNISRSAGTITITWTGGGRLQEAISLTGSSEDWSDVTPAPTGSSYTTTDTTGNRFFRVVR